MLPAVVAFVVTAGVSIYTWSASKISADTASSNQTIYSGTVAITNYLGPELPVSMWKCQEFPIKYVLPTTAAGPSGPVSMNTIINSYRAQIYSDFISINSAVNGYSSISSMKDDLKKCNDGDTNTCSKIEKSILQTAIKPKCDEIRNYDITIKTPAKVYGLTSATSAGASSSQSPSRTASTSTTAAASSSANIPLEAIEPENPLAAPGNNSKTVIIKVRSSKTKRILGGVSIELQNIAESDDKLTLTTADPPPIEGKQVTGFSKATYKLVAKRNGYEVYETNVNANTKNQYINIDIPMKPLAGLPDPDNNAYLNAFSLLSNLNLSNLGGSTISIINNLARLLGQNNGSIFNNYPYQTGYSSNLSQIAVVPVQLTVQPEYPFNQLNTNVKFEIQEVATAKTAMSTTFNLNSLSDGSTTGIVRYGCLNPDSQYILKLTSINNTKVTFQPYSFISGSLGEMTTLLVPLGANEVTQSSDLLSSTVYRNIDRSSLVIDNFNCPSTSLSSSTSGQNTWVNSTITESQLRSYALTPLNDKYYLVNTTVGSTDIHSVVFVKSQGSTGGLAFISAASGLNVNSSSQSGWYATTFTISNNEPIINKTKLSRVNLTPNEYANTINSTVAETLK